jgi:hypothetical protein
LTGLPVADLWFFHINDGASPNVPNLKPYWNPETKCLRKTESYSINSVLRTLLITGLGRLGTLEKLFFSTGCFTRPAWEWMGASTDLTYVSVWACRYLTILFPIVGKADFIPGEAWRKGPLWTIVPTQGIVATLMKIGRSVKGSIVQFIQRFLPRLTITFTQVPQPYIIIMEGYYPFHFMNFFYSRHIL